MHVGDNERATQNRVVALFKNELGYEYLGNWEDRPHTSNVEVSLLKRYWATKNYSADAQSRAIEQLQRAATNLANGLYLANAAVYQLLRYGIKVKTGLGEQYQTLWLLDWQQPECNDFALAEEVTVAGKHQKRPDVVLYVNGIALGVLELKRATVSVGDGIRQNLDNQKPEFIESFFSTMGLVLAGNDTEGLRYGTIETKAKYYLTWKEDTFPDREPLDRALLQLGEKSRFIELLRDFIAYDRGTKKVPRPHQYIGMRKAQEFIARREGGIIWHTQGSGKSLTMVWLAAWILENVPNARVLVVTDRDELDEQIEGVFQGVSRAIYRTKNGADLLAQLNGAEQPLLCSLIHKFGKRKPGQPKLPKTRARTEEDYAAFIADLQAMLPAGFRAKGDVYVFVDECHRTQSGLLNRAMKAILPESVFIGFTGTPLLASDKLVLTSQANFGEYIHEYKFDEAVADEVVLDLQYEARSVEQNLTNQTKVDQWFEAKTRGLTENAKAQLKQRWGTMQKVLSSKSRLSVIADDILLDMETVERLQNGRGNAMLVAKSIYEACKYWEIFQEKGFKKCAVVTSYVPNIADLKGEGTGDDEPTERIAQYEIYQKMLAGRSAEDFEANAKKLFVEAPAQMKLLIVVDKLLTGFDAPPCTYLYIDKKMQDHGLFQAICRVNRLDDDDKRYGYVVDYQNLFESLEQSIQNYTGEALGGYADEDVKGLLKNRLEKGKTDLDDLLEALRGLVEPVETPRDSAAYRAFFNGPNPEDEEPRRRRLLLYKTLAATLRAYANLAGQLTEAGYSAADAQKLGQEVKFFTELRDEIKLASGDYIDLKAYEPAMRYLIDTYIGAKDSEKVSAFDGENMSLVKLIVERGAEAIDALPERIRSSPEAVAETIENNVRKLIINEQASNPAFYGKMSDLLSTLVEERKQRAREYADYLASIIELTRQVADPAHSVVYPPTITSRGKRALYDNLEQDEPLTLALDDVIQYTKKAGWTDGGLKEKQLKNAIKPLLGDDTRAEQVIKILKQQPEYR